MKADINVIESGELLVPGPDVAHELPDSGSPSIQKDRSNRHVFVSRTETLHGDA